MVRHYIVIWELADGVTQDQSNSMPLEDAVEFLGSQVIKLNGSFNWIQIEPEAE